MEHIGKNKVKLIFDIGSLIIIPVGLKHTETLNVILYYKYLKSDIVKIVGWMLWKVKVTP
jgi:hypothetical protein